MYSELLKKLDKLRCRTARFRRVILHLHSPQSFDWARSASADKVRNDKSRFLADKGTDSFIQELKPHYDLVAITDHMRSGYASILSQTTSPADNCIILPGMEVNFIPESALGIARIHLVVILPEHASVEDFARLFYAQNHIPADDSRTGQEDVKGVNLKDWVDRVKKQNGICIAAHIDNQQGIRCRFRQTAVETLRLFADADKDGLEKENEVPEALKKYLFESGLTAVEIQQASHAEHYRWESEVDGKTQWLPTVLTSDAHCVEDFTKKDRITYIKMTERSLQGIKDAFSFPDTRIRFPDNLPEAPNPRLLGIQIAGNDTSFFKDVTIAFAENLNCLIGVRGSGKSTLVEAMRYLFGYNRTLAEVGESLETSIREMQQSNLTGSVIRLVYRTKEGDERFLQATYDSKEDYATKIYSASGDFINVPDVEKSGDYPLRLYGWSEIENLGRIPARR